jgi:hypothetical protein
MVSRRLERQGHNAYTQLAGLHHDDAEAFLGDVTRPLKSLFQPVYEDLTVAMDTAIVLALNLPITRSELSSPAVKAADNWALFIEAEHLLPSKGVHWGGSGAAWGIGEDSDRVTDADLWTGGQDPWTASADWLNRHLELMREIDDIEDARKAIAEHESWWNLHYPDSAANDDPCDSVPYHDYNCTKEHA